MSAAQNTVDTVNAAATAIVTAESRVQPTTVQVCCLVCFSLSMFIEAFSIHEAFVLRYFAVTVWLSGRIPK